MAVVHRHPIMDAGLRSFFESQAGMHVVRHQNPSAADGGPADRADLIVADYGHGMAWLQRGSDSQTGADARVLILLDIESEREIRAALSAGADGLLLSSSTLDELQQAASSVLRGMRHLSPAVASQLADSLVRVSLTDRELSVLNLIASGMCNKAIARELTVSIATVKTHVSSILEKLGVSSRTQAVSKAGERRLIAPLFARVDRFGHSAAPSSSGQTFRGAPDEEQPAAAHTSS